MKSLHSKPCSDVHRVRVATWLLVLSWASIGRVGAAGDDVVVDSSNESSTTVAARQQALVGNVVIRGGHGAVLVGGAGRQPAYDLGGLFDQHVFGRAGGRNQVFIINGQTLTRGTSSLEQAIATVRERCEHRIETLEKLCGLDVRQVRTLAMAMESDLKRVGSHIEAERERYVGRTMAATPQGLDRDVLEEVRACGMRCRGLLDSLPGPDALLGSVVSEILTPEQASNLAMWVDGRRASRWKAMVKTVLVQLDESGLGLSSAQAQALEASLLSDVPKLDVLRDSTQANHDGRLSHFQAVLVKSRLGLRKDAWEHLLDPRQQAMLTLQVESTGDPASVEQMLVDQGMLVRENSQSHRQEAP